MRFVLRRVAFFLLTLWVALTLNFALPRMMPGNPALAIIGKFKSGISPQAVKVLEAQFGIETHQNIVAQYFSYLGNVATLRFGTSLTTQPGASVGRIVLDAIPWTLGLVGVTTVLAFILGTGIGIVAAWRRGGRLDGLMPPIFVIMTVIPYFWIGLVLILVFGVKLKLLPYFFTYNFSMTPGFNLAFIGNVAEHAILPNLTGFAMSLGFVVGGAILIEQVFNYQGVGWLLLQAVDNNDYPLIQALFLLITVAVLLAILISDLATAALDPRTRAAG